MERVEVTEEQIAEAAEWFEESDSEDDFRGFDPSELRAAQEHVSDLSSSDSESESETVDLDDSGFVDEEQRDPTVDAYEHAWLPAFDNSNTGSKLNIQDVTTEGELFDMIFNANIQTHIIQETNRYAAEKIAQQRRTKPTLGTRARGWTPIGIEDLRAFIGLMLFFGLDRRQSYDSYWTLDTLAQLMGVRQIMARDRFLSILQFLHVADNSQAHPRDSPLYDPLHKIRTFSELLVSSWQDAYSLGRNVAVDETIIPFKGRTRMKQYKPNKPHKWGVNVWSLACSKTGYVWNWSLYSGKKETPEHGLTHGVVTKLCSPLYGKFHHVYMDNFFTAPKLFIELGDNGLGACGTLRVNRVGVPEAFKSQSKALKKHGEQYVLRDGRLLFVSWYDKRAVNIVSTVHNSSTFVKNVRSRDVSRRTITKPKTVELYTKHMGGVDRADQQMWHMMNLHKSIKWWKKVFVSLLEVTFVNCAIIWRATHPRDHYYPDKFRLAIIHSLVRMSRSQSVGRPRSVLSASALPRLTERHFPKVHEIAANGRRPRLDCVVCSDRALKRCRTAWHCDRCNAAMCSFPCFEFFHTKMNYKIPCPGNHP